MIYYCECQEKATVRNRLAGYVEAESEEEAAKKIHEGDVEIVDSLTVDEFDNTVISIDIINESE